VSGCGRLHYGGGLCRAHWVRLKEHGDLQPDKPIKRFRASKCEGEGCERRKPPGRDYCSDCVPRATAFQRGWRV
jgi:hypothetical protein